MNIKKRKIFSILLAATMIFTAAAFTACTEKTPPEEEQTIKVTMKITASDGTVLCDFADGDHEITDVPSKFTVFDVTKQICGKLSIVFEEADGMVDKIGEDQNSEVVITEETEETEETTPPPTEETEEGEEAPTTEATTEAPPSYFWTAYVNDLQVNSSTVLKDGDKIEWKFEIQKDK